jgi:hypothetical protein
MNNLVILLLLLPTPAVPQAGTMPAADLAPCKAAPVIQRIAINHHELRIVTPKDWCSSSRTESLEFTSSRPGWLSSIDLDWYQPPRDRAYRHFDARIAREIRYRRRDRHHVQVRKFVIGGLHAVDIRSIDGYGSIVAETLIGVPRDETDNDLFVITFSGPDTKVGRQHLSAYEEILTSMQVSPGNH